MDDGFAPSSFSLQKMRQGTGNSSSVCTSRRHVTHIRRQQSFDIEIVSSEAKAEAHVDRNRMGDIHNESELTS